MHKVYLTCFRASEVFGTPATSATNFRGKRGVLDSVEYGILFLNAGVFYQYLSIDMCDENACLLHK